MWKGLSPIIKNFWSWLNKMKPIAKSIIIVLIIFFLLCPTLIFSEDCQKAAELYNQGTSLIDPYEREKYFRQVILLCSEPDVLVRAYNNLADSFERRKEYSQALSFYKKAIEIKKDHPTPYHSAGDIFSSLGDYYSAFIMYDKGLKYSSQDKEIERKKEIAKENFKKKMIIYFDLDSSKISDLYIYRLQLIGECIQNHPSVEKIEVVGHTCSLGSKASNHRLSEQRAGVVVQYLNQYCPLVKNKLVTRGQGEENPLLPNEDNNARELNRRVEVIIP